MGVVWHPQVALLQDSVGGSVAGAYQEVLLRLASGRDLGGYQADASLIELAQRHGLIGALADASDSSLVKAIHARQVARCAVMRRQLESFLAVLADNGIRATPIKGPVVAQHYRKPEIRHFSDIDLLVERERLDESLGVLGRLDAVVSIPPKRPKAAKRDILVRDDSGIRFNLDLHWDLFSYSQVRGSADGATPEAWENARFDPDGGIGPHWNLPEAHRIAFLSAHAVLDHRFRLVLFRDLLEMARGPVDWDEVESVARRWKLRSTTYLALWMTQRLLDADIPSDFLESIRPSSIALRFLENAIPRTDLTRFDGHSIHPINLAAVTLHDDVGSRVALVARAPAAFPGWRRRVVDDESRRDTPRTLIVVSTNRRRGAEVFSERLRDGLRNLGWVVDAVALRGYGDEETADLTALVHGDSHPGRFNWRIWRELRRYVREFSPDLVVANGGATLRYGLSVTLGTKRELAYISIGEPHFWIRSWWSRLATRLMLRAADRILAVSSATRQQTIELEPSVADRTFVTYTGLPEDLFHLNGSETSGQLRILMVGNLSAEKDPELAFRAISAAGIGCLRVVGDGPLRDDLEVLARDLGLDEAIEFAGSVADVRPHLEWADVLLLTSRSEGLPGAVLEASAAGVPTVGVDVGGVSEAVVDGFTGLVVPRSAADLADALERLAGDRAMLERMGAAAREHARERFSMSDVVDRYARILQGLGP